MQALLYLVTLVTSVLALLHLFRAHRRSSQRHPVLKHGEWSQANTISWRWRRPRKTLGLVLEDGEEASTLVLPHELPFVEKTINVAGYALALFCVGLLVFSLGVPRWQGGAIAVLVFFFMAPLAGLMLYVGSTVVRIELRADEARMVLRYGIWLLRSVRHRPGRLRVSGRYQGVWHKGREDRVPLYELRIRGRVPGLGRRYLMHCNRSQGSWIIAGLTRWSETVSRPRDEQPGSQDPRGTGNTAAFPRARLLRKRSLRRRRAAGGDVA